MRDRHGLGPEAPLSPKGGVVLVWVQQTLSYPISGSASSCINKQLRCIELPDRRYLSVKPILFMSQRTPGGLHSFVPAIRGVVACGLRELRTMLGVFAEDFRLLHAVLPAG
jgi:hypothetical protein